MSNNLTKKGLLYECVFLFEEKISPKKSSFVHIGCNSTKSWHFEFCGMGPNLHFCCMRLPIPEIFLADIFCICDRFQEIWICNIRIQAHCVCF